MTLQEKIRGRQNSITALRLCFAALVVFTHACELGGFGHDPFGRKFGVNLGEIGLNAFFSLSGYLITRSWMRSPSLVDFFRKRILRIFPGFWVCLALCAFVLLPAVFAVKHGVSFWHAFGAADFSSYFFSNSLLRIRQQSFPGLFETNPAYGVVNGSLWSLFPEFLCYVMVAICGLLLLFRPGKRPILIVGWVTLLLVTCSGPWILEHLKGNSHVTQVWYVWRVGVQASYFVSGMIIALYCDKIQISPLILTGATAAVLVSIGCGAYSFVSPVILPYVLLGLSTVLPGASLDKVGDFSYGMYLYHYPIQQTLVFFGLASQSLTLFFLSSFFLALIPSIGSWFLVEKPALNLKFKALKGNKSSPAG